LCLLHAFLLFPSIGVISAMHYPCLLECLVHIVLPWLLVLTASAHTYLVHDFVLSMSSTFIVCYLHLPQYPLVTNFGKEEEIRMSNISKVLFFILKNVEFVIFVFSSKKILSVLLVVTLIMVFSNVSMNFFKGKSSFWPSNSCLSLVWQSNSKTGYLWPSNS
jgi:hypothetical protein